MEWSKKMTEKDAPEPVFQQDALVMPVAPRVPERWRILVDNLLAVSAPTRTDLPVADPAGQVETMRGIAERLQTEMDVKADGETADLIDSIRTELLNTPVLHEFAEGVVLEALHQRERWGSEHDAGKAPLDWFWLIGYLAQKVVTALDAGDSDKALHHTISTAAVLANWHAHIENPGAFRPGLGGQRMTTEQTPEQIAAEMTSRPASPGEAALLESLDERDAEIRRLNEVLLDAQTHSAREQKRAEAAEAERDEELGAAHHFRATLRRVEAALREIRDSYTGGISAAPHMARIAEAALAQAAKEEA